MARTRARCIVVAHANGFPGGAAHLVGHSMGGDLSLLVASGRPSLPPRRPTRQDRR